MFQSCLCNDGATSLGTFLCQSVLQLPKKFFGMGSMLNLSLFTVKASFLPRSPGLFITKWHSEFSCLKEAYCSCSQSQLKNQPPGVSKKSPPLGMEAGRGHQSGLQLEAVSSMEGIYPYGKGPMESSGTLLALAGV